LGLDLNLKIKSKTNERKDIIMFYEEVDFDHLKTAK